MSDTVSNNNNNSGDSAGQTIKEENVELAATVTTSQAATVTATVTEPPAENTENANLSEDASSQSAVSSGDTEQQNKPPTDENMEVEVCLPFICE